MSLTGMGLLMVSQIAKKKEPATRGSWFRYDVRKMVRRCGLGTVLLWLGRAGSSLFDLRYGSSWPLLFVSGLQILLVVGAAGTISYWSAAGRKARPRSRSKTKSQRELERPAAG